MQKDIYLAGGCFWGVEEYFRRLPGVIATQAGYAQSAVKNPSYEDVCSGKTNAAETVKITYDSDKMPLAYLLRHYYRIIDPLARNRQGNDIGTQYRTGIYYTDAGDAPLIAQETALVQNKYKQPLAVEISPLENFYPAEDYHQKYLVKHPGGYCHINFESLSDPELDPKKVSAPADAELRAKLSPVEYYVTRQNGTEPPFSGKYWQFDKPGIYVDVTSGEPLFLSSDKFPSACGWPSFSAPVNPGAVKAKEDHSHGMERIEIRSAEADSHLGHVFPDGPKERGGLRYCINSAALRFIPIEDMAKMGYEKFIPLLENRK